MLKTQWMWKVHIITTFFSESGTKKPIPAKDVQSFPKEMQHGLIYFAWSPGSVLQPCLVGVLTLGHVNHDLDPGLQEKSKNPLCISFGKKCNLKLVNLLHVLFIHCVLC